MILSPSLQSLHHRYQPLIEMALRQALDHVHMVSGMAALDPYYGQMRYQLGWVDAALTPVKSQAGKRLRPLLLLLAYEAAGAWGLAGTDVIDTTHLRRALPAAAAIEFLHNLTLIHDDIEDGDTLRRHHPTLWTIWGMPQAINAGDGMFALARLTLWSVLERGVEPTIAVRLGEVFDRACLVLSEGQFLDISFEDRQGISVALYLEMIRRKTAALMGCTAEMGARLATSDEVIIERLRCFGQAVGIAFQVRDDILGIWATSTESGKTAAGDIFRRKQSLPLLHALSRAGEQDRRVLHMLYQQEAAVTQAQVDSALEILERTQTREYCSAFLAEQCRLASEALACVPRSRYLVSESALNSLGVLVHFVEGVRL